MPPKKKDDREKLRKEEVERKLKEEEERRKAEVEARQEEEKREKVAREERERLRIEEKSRFQEINERLNKEFEAKRIELESWKQERLAGRQWEHFMSCDTIPDPSNEKALNTYLTLCEEDTAWPLIQDVLINIDHWLKITDGIQQLLNGDGLPKPTLAESKRYQQVLQRISTLILKKLDQSTLFYMGEAEKHTDSESCNLKVEDSLESRLTYCLWGNVVKNPRLKNFSFDKKLDFTLDLPKPLLLADVAIRVMQLDFDPLSSQSHSYNLSHTRVSSGVSTLSEGAASNEGDVLAGNQGEEGGEEGRLDQEGVESSRQQTEGVTEDCDGGELGDGDAADIAPPSTTVLEGTVGTKDGEEPVVPDSGETIKKYVEDEIDLRSFRPAGGPIFIKILELPPNSKVVNNWTVRKVLTRELPLYTYPAEIPCQASLMGDSTVTHLDPIPGSSSWPAIGITMKLPETYIFSEEPQIAHWDSTENIWRTKGISDSHFNMTIDDKTVSFQTYYFSPLAIMVDQYTNMPYQSWEMLGCGENHTLLTLEGGVTQITVQIKGDSSTLIGPTDQLPLTHLLNRPMTARELMNALAKVGANFFPQHDSSEYVRITKKRTLVEEEMYRGMALVSCGYAFMWSRWNSHAGCGKLVVRVAEGGCEMETDKLTWMHYVGGKRSFRLDITEDSETFSLEPVNGYLAYPGIYSALEHAASPTVSEIIRGTSPAHTETVEQWLSATKVLTYT